MDHNSDRKEEVLEQSEKNIEVEKEEHPLISIFKKLDLKKDDTKEIFCEKIKTNLNIDLNILPNYLSEYLKNHAEELTLDIGNISPYGDYEKLIEDNDGMSDFLKTEASKSENWQFNYLEAVDKDSSLIKLVFLNKAVDQGDLLRGIVLINAKGAVRHTFVVSG